MSEEIVLTKEMLLESLAAWKDYPARIEDLSSAQKAAFLKKQGYQSTHELLSHITGWWDEAFAIVEDVLAGRERPRREYDFDVFNAESIARFKPWSENELLAYYETMRQKLITQISSLTDDRLKIKRVGKWLYGVIIDHAEEHALG